MDSWRKPGKRSQQRSCLTTGRQIQARDHNAWICHVLRREAEGLILPKLPAFRRGE